MKSTIQYLENFLKENDSIVLALSGGPDSMCLLHLLLEIKAKKNLNIICVHINHNTREACQREMEFVQKYMKEKNINFEYFKIEEYRKGKFSETEAREKRYQYFKDVVNKYQANYLFTAHHGDDLVETIIMRLLRGSTLKGYAGFKKDSTWDNVRIIRPLINLKKIEIMEYLKQNNIPYVIDESNNTDIYLRNKIRHNILPLLEELEPNYNKKFLNFSEVLLKSNILIEEEINQTYELIRKKNKILKNEFLKLSLEFQEAILMRHFKDIYRDKINQITEKHIKIAISFIRNPKNKSSINFPCKFILIKDAENFWLQKLELAEKYCIKLEEKVILPNEELVIQKNTYQEKSNFEIHLNSKEIVLPLYLTTRVPGMKMEVKNLNGTKKVSDILINSKIPKEQKDSIPILIDSNGTVLWILGVKKSKYDLEKNENYDIIYQYIKKEGIN